MPILTIYRRVLTMLGNDTRLAVLLGLANIVVAGLQFLDPVLFGRVIGLLSHSDQIGRDALWLQAAQLIGLWLVVGASSIGANIATVVHAERMAHRNRLRVMSRFFAHILSLPLSFHGEAQSGRLMKVMLGGSDAMFSVWLTFFREQLATYIATLVLLPLTLFLNWQLALVLIVLVVLFCSVTVFVINRTEAGQSRAEFFQSSLAGTAQDALANVMVVQSFTRLAAETRRFGQIADQVIANQFPVLNWWAMVNVLTRGASTIAVIIIVLVGTLLHIDGKASIGEIVSFMGFANLLIGRLESAMQFASRLFLQRPVLQEFFGVLDAKSSVPEAEDAVELEAPRGEVAFEAVSFAYPGGPAILSDVSFVAQPGAVIALVGPNRRRQKHGNEPAAAPVGPDRRAGGDRRPGYPARDAGKPAAIDRRGVSRKHAVQPLDPRKPAHRQARGDGRGCRTRLPHGGRARLHHAPAAGLRHPGGGAWGYPVRRPSASAWRSPAPS